MDQATSVKAAKFINASTNSEFPLSEWLRAKDSFQKALSELEIFEVYPSETPFFLLKLLVGTATELKTSLIEQGLLIRDATNFDLLEGEYIRLNTLDSSSNSLLINALHQWKHSIALPSLSL